MRILGIDLGEKRVGVALSDELGITAQPLETFESQGPEKDLAHLNYLIKTYRVEELVVGLPKTQKGKIGNIAKEVMNFVEICKKEFHIPIITWDERFTTMEATRALIEAGLSRKKRKRIVDKIAATLILQGYLNRRARKDL